MRMLQQLSPLVWLVLLVIVAFAVSRIYDPRKYALARQWNCLSPRRERNWDPIFGIDRIHQLYTSLRTHCFVQSYHERFLKSGRTFQSTMLMRTKIYTVHPKNLEAVLSKNASDYWIGHDRTKVTYLLMGNGVFTASDEHWKWSRAIIKSGMPFQRAFNSDFFARHTSHLIERIPKNGAMVDLQDLFFDMTLESASDLIFGRSVKSLEIGFPVSAAQFSMNSQEAQESGLRISRLGVLAYLYPRERFRLRQSSERSRYYIKHVMRAAIKSCDSKELADCLLGRLLDSTTDETELVDQLITVLIAARDTTASLLSSQFHLLARRPDVWTKLRKEVSVLGDEVPTVQQVKQLKYVSWVINETLRLYPPSPHNTRVALKDTFLPTGGGPSGESPVFVAKGQAVSYDTYTLHRDKALFGSNAEDFVPERWEGLKPGWGFLPFGGGPRLCLGQPLALMEAAYTTVRLAQHFTRIEPLDSRAWEELLTITCTNRHGTKVALYA